MRLGAMLLFFAANRGQPGAAGLSPAVGERAGVSAGSSFLMIASNLLERMESAGSGAALAGSAEPRPMSGITVMRKKGSRDCGTGRVRAGSRLWMGRRRCV